MALEIAPTPAPTARSPLPPLQPPRPGDPDDGDALHAALLEGLGAQPRDAVPDIPPAALAAMRGAARAQLVARLRRDPVFVQAATHHVRALARAAGYGLRADANVVDAWAGQLLPTGCHAPAERAFATAVAAEFGAPWREPRALSERAVAALLAGHPPAFGRLFDPTCWDGLRFQGVDSGLEPLVRSLYAETQAWLQAHGIGAAALWRGVAAPGVAGLTMADPRLAPVSWWSTSYRVARIQRAWGTSRLLCARVPAARILATGRTGSGGAEEAEVLVLGGTADRGWTLAWAGPNDPLAACTLDDYQQLIAAAGDADALSAADAAALVQARRPVDPPPPPWVPRRLDAYQPDASYWLYQPDGIHGVSHAARVLVWADYVAAAQQAAGVAVDREAVRVAAVLHDCRRYDNGTDQWHGERAAAWFGRQAATIAPRLTAAQVARVQYLLAWHVPPDGACPAMTPELMALKDGDSLDCVRLVDYDARYLRTPYLVGEMIRATRLWEASRVGAAPPWARVRAAARALGLWPDA